MSRESTATVIGGWRAQVCRKGVWLDAEVEGEVAGAVHVVFSEEGSLKRKKMGLRDGNLRIPVESRPPFLAGVDEVTPEMREVQRSCPTRWAMSLRQWNQFIDFCKASPAWRDLKKKKKQGGHIDLNDMNDRFIKPWTRGTGCSVAVLMNKDTQVEAQVMLSHAWDEDMEECQRAVNLHFQGEGIPEETTVWFCGFGLYQPEDGHGPTIREQSELRPFSEVISSATLKADPGPGRMLAVHTTGADLWERMWCIREVREAMTEKVKIRAAFSPTYEQHFKKEYAAMIRNGCSHADGLDAAGITVRTAKAHCRPEDKDTLLQELLKHGTLLEIDRETTKLRAKLVDHFVLDAAGRAATTSGQPLALLDLARQGELEAVDWLHEVAAAGGEPAQDALFALLEPAARKEGLSIELSRSSLGLKDRKGAFELILVLLQTMAHRQHEKSFGVLAGDSNRRDLRGCNVDEAYDREVLEQQLAYPSIQALVKLGSQRALDELLSKAQSTGEAHPAPEDRECGRRALECLAGQWSRPVLRALRELPPSEDWAEPILQGLRESLADLPGSGSASQ